MSNYKYKVGDEEMILSAEEDVKVKEAIKAGGGLVSLREGKILVNTSFIRTAKETNEMTKEQAEKRYDTLQLSDGEQKGEKRELTYLKKTHDEFYKHMNWSHSPSCSCKVGELEEVPRNPYDPYLWGKRRNKTSVV